MYSRDADRAAVNGSETAKYVAATPPSEQPAPVMLGHHRAAARQSVHGFAIGHQIGDAGHGHGAAGGSVMGGMLGVLFGQILCQRHRRAGCGLHVVDGFHSGGAVLGSVPHGFGIEPHMFASAITSDAFARIMVGGAALKA